MCCYLSAVFMSEGMKACLLNSCSAQSLMWDFSIGRKGTYISIRLFSMIAAL